MRSMAAELDTQIPQPVGEVVVAPAPLDPKLDDLGKRLDDLFSINGRTGERPSDWLRGAVFVGQEKLHANNDWVAQAAHSLREILYRLCSPRMGGGDDATRKFLTKYGAAQDVTTSFAELDALYDKLCRIAHHEIRVEDTDEKTFDNLLAKFDRVMTAALERQLDVHGKIDDLLAQPPEV
jgi:hypothetical protein